jgi:hypothetical protein
MGKSLTLFFLHFLTDHNIDSVNYHEPVGPDGIDVNELRAMEADSMFAEYYHHFDPADGPFPASNTDQAVAASIYDSTNNNVQWGPRQFCHVPGEESDNEENNGDIMASYEMPLTPRFQGIPWSSDFVTASFAMPARPGTIAGMAIRDPTQPAQAPPIIHAEYRFSADTITEMTVSAHESAAATSTPFAADTFDSSLTVAVHIIQARPTSNSRVALSQSFRTSSSPPDTEAPIQSPTDSDAPIQSPVFPVNWITHAGTSMLSSLPPPATPTTPNRRHSRRHTINYIISPPTYRDTEDDESDNT